METSQRASSFRIDILSTFIFIIMVATATLRAQWAPTAGPLGPDIRAVLVSDGTVVAGTSVGVFTTPIEGATWTERNSGLTPFLTVQCFAKSGTNLLAGTSAGLFVSTNNGIA